MDLTAEEKRLIIAYRQADDRAKRDARTLLEHNKQPEEKTVISIGQMLSIARAMGKTVDQLIADETYLICLQK